MKRQHINMRWWVADPGRRTAGLLSSRNLRRLKKAMQEVAPGAKVRFYVHKNKPYPPRTLKGATA